MSDKFEYQGFAIIRSNGKELPSLAGSTLNTGGTTRDAVGGGDSIYGYKRSGFVAPSVTLTVAHGHDVSPDDLNNMVNVTIEFETSIGRTFLLSGAWSKGNATLTDSGDISVVFEARQCKEV